MISSWVRKRIIVELRNVFSWFTKRTQILPSWFFNFYSHALTPFLFSPPIPFVFYDFFLPFLSPSLWIIPTAFLELNPIPYFLICQPFLHLSHSVFIWNGWVVTSLWEIVLSGRNPSIPSSESSPKFEPFFHLAHPFLSSYQAKISECAAFPHSIQSHYNIFQ